MSEVRTILERGVGGATPPPDGFERMLRRRDHKRRNQRITAGVVGIAIFVAAVWVVTIGGSFDRTQRPANEPSAAEDVVRKFLAAFGAFDRKAAMTYVADEADISISLPGNTLASAGGLAYPAPANGILGWLDLFEAGGYQQTITSCQTVPFGAGASVVCGFDFDMIGSDELGLGPVTGSSFVFTVRDGEIVRAGMAWNIAQVSSQMFEPFAKWVSATHPRDVRVMFLDPPVGYLDPPWLPGPRRFVVPSLSRESIRLWRLRTPEYVESAQTGPTQTAPASSGEPDVVRQRPCSGAARSLLELTRTNGPNGLPLGIRVRYEIHRSPVGHVWRIAIRPLGVAGPHPDPPIFRGIRVAGDSGSLAVQLLDPGNFAPFPSPFGVVAEDRQTGEVCRVDASIQSDA